MRYIVVGADHRGYETKETIKNILREKFPDYRIFDVGTNSNVRCDYPHYAKVLGELVFSLNNNEIKSFGIIVCGSGLGVSIACNKMKGIRCGLCNTPEYVELAREHNNINVMALGSRFVKNEDLEPMIEKLLFTPFNSDHQKRVDMLEE